MNPRLPGALVVSLDFELLWGLRDRSDAEARFGRRLRGTRRAVPRILELFREFDVAATWATVGFLFAQSKEEIEETSPDLKPHYVNSSLDPYLEEPGRNEEEDPLRFAASLIESVGATPRQEIATHTFSHYYCSEPGQTLETFRADLHAARSLAERRGYALRSIVFPRNQVDEEYLDALPDFGITCFRGNPPSISWDFSDASSGRRPWRRLARLADLYAGGSPGTVPWDSILETNGLSNVRASCFLAPYRPVLRGLEGLRLKRLTGRVREASRTGSLIHLWWHPHNFGCHLEENLAFLRSVLEVVADCRKRDGMLSLSMAEVDGIVRKEFKEPVGGWTR